MPAVSPPRTERLVFSIAEAAELLGISQSTVRAAIYFRRVATVQLSNRRVGILLADLPRLGYRGAHRYGEFTSNGDEALASAFRDRLVLSYDEVAEALSLSPRTVSRLVHRGTLPGAREVRGAVEAEALRAWLRARRVPDRWEAASAKGGRA